MIFLALCLTLQGAVEGFGGGLLLFDGGLVPGGDAVVLGDGDVGAEVSVDVAAGAHGSEADPARSVHKVLTGEVLGIGSKLGKVGVGTGLGQQIHRFAGAGRGRQTRT